MSADANPPKQPLLFISHKHVDKKIADVVRDFVLTYSGGRIDVYQSSSPWADAPKVGRNLNRELKAALWRARALILIYTTPEHDWNYCIFECGVASHPESADSKLIVFQCAGAVPTLFGDQVNINARKLEDIQKFTNEFLTDATFFPGFSGPITRFQPNSQEVARAAADFAQKLSEPGVLPAEETDPNDEWPAYPYIQFQLDEAEASRLRKSQGQKRAKLAMQVIPDKCVVAKADTYAERLFGVPSFRAGTTLKKLKSTWLDKYPKAKPTWVHDITAQILDAVLWRFPKASWSLMPGGYAPIMSHVRKNSSQQCMQFDVYFFKFTPDTIQSMKVKK